MLRATAKPTRLSPTAIVLLCFFFSSKISIAQGFIGVPGSTVLSKYRETNDIGIMLSGVPVGASTLVGTGFTNNLYLSSDEDNADAESAGFLRIKGSSSAQLLIQNFILDFSALAELSRYTDSALQSTATIGGTGAISRQFGLRTEIGGEFTVVRDEEYNLIVSSLLPARTNKLAATVSVRREYANFTYLTLGVTLGLRDHEDIFGLNPDGLSTRLDQDFLDSSDFSVDFEIERKFREGIDLRLNSTITRRRFDRGFSISQTDADRSYIDQHLVLGAFASSKRIVGWEVEMDLSRRVYDDSPVEFAINGSLGVLVQRGGLTDFGFVVNRNQSDSSVRASRAVNRFELRFFAYHTFSERLLSEFEISWQNEDYIGIGRTDTNTRAILDSTYKFTRTYSASILLEYTQNEVDNSNAIENINEGKILVSFNWRR